MADGRDRKNARVLKKPGVSKAVQDWRDAQAAKNALGQVNTQLTVSPRNEGRPSPWGSVPYNPSINTSSIQSMPKLNYGNVRREGVLQAMREAQQANGVDPRLIKTNSYMAGRDVPTQQMIDNYRSGRYVYSGTNMYNPTREGLEGGPDTVVETYFGGGSPNKHNGARGDGSYKWDTFKNSIGGSRTDREDGLKEAGRSIVKPYKKTYKRIKKLF